MNPVPASARAWHVAIAATVLSSAAAAQCQLVATGLGVRTDRAAASAVTGWDPDGAGPMPEIAVVAGGPPVVPNLLLGRVLEGKIGTFDLDTGVVVPIGAINGLVRDLDVLSNGQLLAAGEFTSGPAGPTAFLSAYDGLQWRSLGIAPNGPVDRVLVLGNGDLIAAGRFTAIGGSPIAYVARWNGSSWSAFGSGVNGRVRTIALDAAGDLIVGGDFTSAGNVGASHIARWDGVAWSPLGVGTDSPVATVTLLTNGHLAVGGYFLQAGGATAQYIAQWDGASWSQLGGNANHFVTDSVLLANGDLLVSGQFWTIGGQQTGTSAVWNGSAWGLPPRPLTAKLAGSVAGVQVLWPYVDSANGFVTAGRGFDESLYQADVDSAGNLYVTGRFENVLGVPAAHVARFDGSSWSALGNGIPLNVGGVYSMCVAENDEVFCGGTLFDFGNPSAYIVSWDGSAWNVVGGGTDARVDALVARPGGGVYAGGAFTVAGGVPAMGIAEFDGSSWSAMGNVAGTCQGLVRLRNGDLVAVGYFTNPAARVIRWNGTAWSTIAATNDITGSVYRAVELPDGSLVVGGLFSNVAGQPIANVARWDGANWSPLGNPTAAVTTLFVLPDGDLLSTNYTSGPQRQVAMRWNGTAWSQFAGIEGAALDFAMLPGGRLAVVGRITEAAGVVVDSFALLDSTCPAALADVPSGCAAPSLHAVADGLPWIGGSHRVDATGFLPNSLAVALVGLSSPGTLLSALHPAGAPGCRQLAAADSAVLRVPSAGATSFSLTIPDSTAFVGLVLFEQFVELRNPGGPLSLHASNGLRLTLGAF